MGAGFNYFREIIPPDVYASAKTTICRYIAVLDAEKYALGEVLRADDYHFLLFPGNAPAMMINDVEYRVKRGDMLVIQP